MFRIDEQPEVFFSNAATSRVVNYAVSKGRARPIARGLYTRNPSDPLEDVVVRNWSAIAGGYFPGAVVVDRAAFELAPAQDGSLTLAARRARDVKLPGLRLRAREGAGPLDGDARWMGEDLYMSSRPRAFLDNLRASRARSGVPRTLNREELERRLDQYAGENQAELNRLRDAARELAPLIGAESLFERLDDLIGALQGTRSGHLRTAEARARRVGQPFDRSRLLRFEQLQTYLLSRAHPSVDSNPRHEVSTFAFFEAYFSNFIEGTEFTLEEAERIVFEGVVPEQRPRDAHDILGTYELVADPGERCLVPETADDLVEILQAQHGVLLRARSEIGPGRFKTDPNRAGSTLFVAPELVEGTLREGYRYLDSLPAGLPRAFFAMFLVSEVHPFADGNGRIARVLMNSELTAAGEQRVVIPIASRDDYLHALRGMTHNGNARALSTVLEALQQATSEVDYSTRTSAELDLRRRGAFDEAVDRGLGL
jgi:Fic family protein